MHTSWIWHTKIPKSCCHGPHINVFFYYGAMPYLCDTVDHWNEYHIMIPLCLTFLCPAANISVYLLSGRLSIREHNIYSISILIFIIARTFVKYCEFWCVSNTISYIVPLTSTAIEIISLFSIPYDDKEDNNYTSIILPFKRAILTMYISDENFDEEQDDDFEILPALLLSLLARETKRQHQ